MRSKFALVSMNGLRIAPRILARSLAITPHPRERLSHPAGELVLETLSNGTQLAVVPTNLSVPRLTVAYKAGSRYESPSNQGITHLMRHVVKHSNQENTQVLTNLSLSQLGVELSSSTSRDLHTVSVNYFRYLSDDVAAFLVPGLIKPLFYQWELKDTAPFMRQEFDNIRASTAHLLELLHSVSYKGSLGHPLFCPEQRLESFTSEACQDFFNSFYRPERTAVVCVGGLYEDVAKVAKAFESVSMPVSQGTVEPKVRWRGAEMRRDNGNPLTRVAVAVEGRGCNHQESLVQSVLAAALGGGGQRVQYAEGSSTSRLQAAANAVSSKPASVQVLNTQYADTGLFGFFLAADFEDAGAATAEVFKAVRAAAKDGLTDAEVARARHAVAVDLAESCAGVSELGSLLSSHLLLKGPFPALEPLQQVTTEQVNALLKSLVKGPTSMASMGRLDSVPYKDELDA